MRLLTHNFILCNKTSCERNSFPLGIEVEKSIYRETDFDQEAVLAWAQRLDWPAFTKTAALLGETSLPLDLRGALRDPLFQKKLHRYLFEVMFCLRQIHIVDGKLKCPNCKQEYSIVNGIPDMNLGESE